MVAELHRLEGEAMTARCERSDLLVDQCAHCRGDELSPASDWVIALPLWRARFDGVCARCSKPIVAYVDVIARLVDDSEYVHEACGVLR